MIFFLLILFYPIVVGALLLWNVPLGILAWVVISINFSANFQRSIY